MATTVGGVSGALPMRMASRVAEYGMREGCELERSLRQSGQDSIVESLRLVWWIRDFPDLTTNVKSQLGYCESETYPESGSF